MQRVIATSWPRASWRPIPLRRYAVFLGIAALGAANAIGLARMGSEVTTAGLPQAALIVGFDWQTFQQAGELAVSGANPYEVAAYRWTPAAAWLVHWIALLPWPAWLLAHVGAALAMPSWRLRLLTLAAFPFWYDVMVGNIMVFVALAAVWALRGNRLAIAALLALTFLAPRPLMLPIAAWLLWTRPEWRLPAGAIAAAVVLGSAATGHLPQWIARLAESRDQIHTVVNVGPSAIIGLTWMPIGLVLAAVLAWRGRLGWAAVVVQPYLIPNYLLMLAVEVDQRRGVDSATTIKPSSSRATQ